MGEVSLTITATSTPRRGVHVADFGAVSDGVADDSAAVLAAIAAAGDRTVWFPAGVTYIGTTTLCIDGGTTLAGEGILATSIRFDGDVGIRVGGTGSTSIHTAVREMTIDGGSVGGVGLEIGDGTATPKSGGGSFARLLITRCQRAGCLLSQGVFATFWDCTFASNDGFGLLMDENDQRYGHTTTTRFYGCNFKANGQAGARTHGVSMTFADCTFEANKREALVIDATNFGAYAKTTSVTRCYFESNLTDGQPGAQLALNGRTDSLHQGAYIDQNYFAATTGAGRYNISVGYGTWFIRDNQFAAGAVYIGAPTNSHKISATIVDKYALDHARWVIEPGSTARVNLRTTMDELRHEQHWVNVNGTPALVYDLDPVTGKMSWNGAARVSRPSGVPVTAEAIHAALVSLGLIEG